MIHYYMQIKGTHVLLALLVAAVFIARFLTAAVPGLKPLHVPVKYLSWAVDVALLTAAMMLLTILPGAFYSNGWLLAKLLALFGFAVCRYFMTRSQPSRLPVWAWFLLGGILLWYAFSVARTHHPLGFLVYFQG